MGDIILVTDAIKRYPSIKPRTLRRLGFKDGKRSYVDCEVVRAHIASKRKTKRKLNPLSPDEYKKVIAVCEYTFSLWGATNKGIREQVRAYHEDLYQLVAMKVSRGRNSKRGAITTYAKQCAQSVLRDWMRKEARRVDTDYQGLFTDNQVEAANKHYEKWNHGGRGTPEGHGPDSDGWDID